MDIINRPHVICFVRSDGALRACYANPAHPGINEDYAVFANRHEANLVIQQYFGPQANGTVYFSVPASALFETKTVTVHSLIKR